MRGSDERSGSLFSYVDLEARVRSDHPLRTIQAIANGSCGGTPLSLLKPQADDAAVEIRALHFQRDSEQRILRSRSTRLV